MSKIKKMRRFKADQELSFTQWTLQLKALLSAEDDLKIQILCWTESSNFTFFSQSVTNQKDRAYQDLVELIDEKLIGGDYCWKLETKLRVLISKKGKK